MNPRLVLGAAAVAVTLAATACGHDSSTAPNTVVSPTSSASMSRGKSVDPTKVEPLKLLKSHDLPLTVSATIGAAGGTLSLAATGLTIVVPPLAVSKPTAFKITAVVGSSVAYDFAPAGTQFAVPLIATQNLSFTQAKKDGVVSPLLVFVGYFPQPSDIATVTELTDISLNVVGQTLTFPIWHFSGYIFASGRAPK